MNFLRILVVLGMVLASSLTTSAASMSQKEVANSVYHLASISQYAANKVDKGQWATATADAYVSAGMWATASTYGSCKRLRGENFCRNNFSRTIRFYQSPDKLSPRGRQYFNRSVNEISNQMGIEW